MSNEIKYPFPGLKNLKKIDCLGIYDVDKDKIMDDPLPNRLSWLADWVADDFVKILADFKSANIPLYFSDMFRHYSIQENLYKEKPKLAKPSGSSYHEAGVAVDIALQPIGDRLVEAYRIFLLRGWTPLGYVRTKMQEVQDGKAKLLELQGLKEAWHIQVQNLDLKFKGGIKEAIGYVGNLKPTT